MIVSPSNRYAGIPNRRTKRNTAFAALLVWMFALASGAMQTLGKHSDIALTEVNAMRKTKSAILDAIHDAAKGMHKAGVTDRVTLPQMRFWNF